MDTLFPILLGIAFFTGIVGVLVTLIMLARKQLVASGDVAINVNDQKTLHIPAGGKLLGALADNGIFVSSACGGGGTCAQCKVKVLDGGGDLLPTEAGHINKKDAREGERLSCQVAVKQDMKIEVPPEVFETKKWDCTVRSNENVATFIKDLILELPEGEEVKFKAGGFIQIEVPPHDIEYKELRRRGAVPRRLGQVRPVAVPQRRGGAGLPGVLHGELAGRRGDHQVERPHRLPAAAGAGGHAAGQGVQLHLQPEARRQAARSPARTASSLSRTPTREMVYIGGGAGMAPLRSHIFQLFKGLKTGRKVSYWYGGRSKTELFYEEEFRQIEKDFPNFQFNIALSDPLPEDNWDGYKGFIHQVLLDNYLKEHAAPEDVEYYICGPPMMLQAVLKTLDDLGVEPENIMFDDFGG